MSKYERMARIEGINLDTGTFMMTLATEGEASDGNILSIKGGQIPERMPMLTSHWNDPSAALGSITDPAKFLKDSPPRLRAVGHIEMTGEGVSAEIRRDLAHMIDKGHITGVSIRWDDVPGKTIRRVNLPSDHPYFVNAETEKDPRKRYGLYFEEWRALEGSVVAVGADPQALIGRADETHGEVSTFWRSMADDVELSEFSRPDVSAAGPEKGKSAVQTIIFSKEKSPSDVNSGKGWTRAKVVSWLKDHDFKSGAIDETDESYRARQFNPEKCAEGSFQTLTQNFPAGVSAVSCKGRSAPIEISDDPPDESPEAKIAASLAALRIDAVDCRKTGATTADLINAVTDGEHKEELRKLEPFEWEGGTLFLPPDLIAEIRTSHEIDPKVEVDAPISNDELEHLLERLEALEERVAKNDDPAAFEEERVPDDPLPSPKPERVEEGSPPLPTIANPNEFIDLLITGLKEAHKRAHAPAADAIVRPHELAEMLNQLLGEASGRVNQKLSAEIKKARGEVST